MENKFSILLADDDTEDRLIMREAFSEIGIGHDVFFTENGEELLKYLHTQQTATLPSLIILDMNMPRLNGLQTLKALKSDFHYKNIPVIIFSTSVNDDEKQDCIISGALSYICKPFTYKEYIDTARNFHQLCSNTIEHTA